MIDLNGEKKSKPVYVGKEQGDRVPAPNVAACALLSAILVLTMVCLVVVWSVTR